MTLPWRPDIDAAVGALAAKGDCSLDQLLTHPDFAADLRDDVRAVLDASGATREIERLRAVLAAAHKVLELTRAEADQWRAIGMPLLLGPIITPTSGAGIPEQRQAPR